MSYSDPRNVVVAAGTLATVNFSMAERCGVIRVSAGYSAAAALGHAKFLAPHVTDWAVVVEG